MKILVTGSAGFIGSALCHSLLKSNHEVLGLDNLNDYYDVELKKARLARLESHKSFHFFKLDLADRNAIKEFFKTERPQRVVNLAAQAGVRYSLVNPYAYLDSNIYGFVNILEGCRHYDVEHLVYASTSSVYGLNTKMPFSTHDAADHPVSLYAATKKANEAMAHSYAHMFGVPSTGLRFFTVYGPWGRPDMALFIFTKNILEGKPIEVFNGGKHRRDFTYVDDIVGGIYRVVEGSIPTGDSQFNSDRPDPSTSSDPFRLYNIGNNRCEELMRYIEVIEDVLGKKAEKKFLPMQAGDIEATYANVDDLIKDYNYKPDTPIEVGIKNFIEWYREYYRV